MVTAFGFCFYLGCSVVDLLCTLGYNVCNKKFSRRNSFAVCDMVIKQGDLFQTTVSSYGSNGEGVAYVGEYTVFVPFTVEGEVVEVRAVYVKKNICYAQLTRVLKPSPRERLRVSILRQMRRMFPSTHELRRTVEGQKKHRAVQSQKNCGSLS